MVSSITEETDRIRPNMCSDPPRKVRFVAKIRAFTDQEFESLNGSSAPWITTQKPAENSSGRVKIFFGDQSISRKDAYEVDYCYEQNEDSGLIFSKELKPLISEVFVGRNVSVIAYGARGSGKTYTIQGSEETPGLATRAMCEILSEAEETGKLVTISLYEVFQDHVYDLLDPKRSEIQILEDAQGKIQLKGLSQVFVKSISEFHSLYFSGCNTRKPVQKVALELPRRSHKGLMVNISSNDEQSNVKLVGKMNFVDLAGYEDARRKSIDSFNHAEGMRINKSLYALLNVVHALNAKESRVPYRESKLTRILQDTLGGRNHVLMLTCLNPSFCQDTIYTVSLASRSCQGVNRVSTSSTKESKSSSKSMMLPSSLKKGKVGIFSTTVKKQTGLQVHFSEKKGCSTVKGRKLFDEGNQLIRSNQTKTTSNIASTMQSKFSSEIDSVVIPYLQEEEKAISDISSAILPQEEETLLQSAQRDTKRTTTVEKEKAISDISSAILPQEEETLLQSAQRDTECTTTAEKDVLVQNESTHLEVTPGSDSIKALCSVIDGHSIGKENKNLLVNEDESPPISARLQQLSNNLKSLLSSTPLHIEIPQEIENTTGGQVVPVNVVEPKTPVIEQDPRVNEKWEVAKIGSPWDTFSTRSSRMKNSLVQDYLRVLNSASKEDLKRLKGIGEKRATSILELREESPEPFKSLDDLKDIGLSAKQVKGMMKKVAGDLFD